MPFVETITAALVGGGAAKIATGVAEAVDRFVETEEERKAADRLLIKIQQEPDKWQAEINKIEASHRSLFVAGWRPAIGWICAMALFWGWIVGPFLVFLNGIFGSGPIELPAVELSQTISLVMAMLGMGALRSYEKSVGISK